MVTLPKPLTSKNKAKGRFVKQDFRYVKEGGSVSGCLIVLLPLRRGVTWR